jgi:hypothetical protein
LGVNVVSIRRASLRCSRASEVDALRFVVGSKNLFAAAPRRAAIAALPCVRAMRARLPARWALGASLLASLLSRACAHSRWVCPAPADASIGLKLAPCGGSGAAAALHTQRVAFTAAPGPLTVVWEEGVPHGGAPARIALALEDTPAGWARACVLLDHIPHRDAPLGAPPVVPGVPGSYTRSRLTLTLPDVRCERCVLQLVTAMTDAAHGVPHGARCALRPFGAAGNDAEDEARTLPLCPAYFSCATIAINGTAANTAANVSAACGALPADWPHARAAANVYGSAADVGRWSRAGWLLDAPPAYRAPAGPCAAAQ